MLFWKTQSASGNEILETIKAAPQSTYPDELVVIHATHVLYSRNGKWRDLRKDFGKMILYIRSALMVLKRDVLIQHRKVFSGDGLNCDVRFWQ